MISEPQYLQDEANAYLFALPSVPFWIGQIYIQPFQTACTSQILMVTGSNSIWLILFISLQLFGFINPAIKGT
jgi:hypothetical protein